MIGKLADNIFYFFNGPAKLLYKKLKASESSQVCIYGAGEIGQALLQEIRAHGKLTIHSIVDRKAEYLQTELEGFTLQPPHTLKTLPREVVVAIASEAFLDEIIARIKRETSNTPPTVVHL
ncbi:hypothetical protein [Bowmanella denitrificans]|uniref:hypothetical protein n=1 Tax=Bowmanella denitrificans TaxID=366582 RepID=UPI000C99F2B9|nr:hypothetical protein [Bowmanella denitrificans]